MKTWAISFVVAGALVGAPGWTPNEPSERDMQFAFEGALSLQVQNALEFAAETGGADAVAAIRDHRTDAFAISSFRKLKCSYEAVRLHRCEFQVDLDLSNGKLERTLSGRFVGGVDGLRYQDI